jgi:PAS domain S-box-containing protein
LSNKKLILTIDDEKFIRHSFRAFLEDMSYAVTEAENGKIGIDKCREQHPDLVLLDLKMPEMGGIDVLKVLIKEYPLLPIIVVSGVGLATDVIEAIHCGAWDYILKPIQDFQMLEYAIERALEKAKLLKENNQYQENLEEMVLARTKELQAINKQLKSEIQYRKYVEENLFNSQKMLTSILETVPDIIYRLDEKGNINFISDAVQKYNYKPYEFMDRPIEEFIHPEDIEKSKWLLKTRRTGKRKTKNFEIRMFQSPQTSVYPTFMLEAEGIYNEGENRTFIGTQGVFRDISLRKEAENKVKKSLQEKESLLKEVHHRVKNNMQIILSLLSIQMKDIKSEEIQNILKESQNRIMSMAIVHESIYKTDNFAEINMDNFVRTLYAQISQSYQMKKNIKIEFDLEKLFVTLDSSVPLAIILNEVFTNIFKHAFKDHNECLVRVTMKKIEGSFALVTVEDNGSGIKKGVNINKPETMGLSLIKTLTRQLSGKLKIEDNNPGTRVALHFNTKIIQSTI